MRGLLATIIQVIRVIVILVKMVTMSFIRIVGILILLGLKATGNKHTHTHTATESHACFVFVRLRAGFREPNLSFGCPSFRLVILKDLRDVSGCASAHLTFVHTCMYVLRSAMLCMYAA